MGERRVAAAGRIDLIFACRDALRRLAQAARVVRHDFAAEYAAAKREVEYWERHPEAARRERRKARRCAVCDRRLWMHGFFDEGADPERGPWHRYGHDFRFKEGEDDAEA